jgi:hypothetical protein
VEERRFSAALDVLSIWALAPVGIAASARTTTTGLKPVVLRIAARP